MGVNVYGQSDAEQELIRYLEGNFQEIKISSLDEYAKFSKYPEGFRKKKIDDCDVKIQNCIKKGEELKKDQYEIENEIKSINYGISRSVANTFMPNRRQKIIRMPIKIEYYDHS